MAWSFFSSEDNIHFQGVAFSVPKILYTFQCVELSVPKIVYTSRALSFHFEWYTRPGNMAIEHVSCPKRLIFREIEDGGPSNGSERYLWQPSRSYDLLK